MDTKQKLGKTEYSVRGFPFIRFKDRYDQSCSLQLSSLAEREKPGTSAIWFGVDEVKPIIPATDATRLGLEPEKINGWVEYKIPKEVQLNARMHLGREQVEALIGHLKNWLENDEL